MSIASTALSHHETPRAMQRRTYTIDEVAALLGLSRNSAYVAAREGRLPIAVIKIGKRMMVSRAALDRFLETGEAAH
jgi:excisionase family DNA binding protein